MTFVRFLHVIGIALWLGAGAAALVFATAARQDTPMRLPRVLLLGRLYTLLIAPGAMLATASGLALTMMAASGADSDRLGEPALAAMQSMGLLAGVLEIFVAFPTAQRLTAAGIAAMDGAAWAGEAPRGRLVALLWITLSLVVASTYLGLLG
jgi:hypothetical protein